MATVVADMSMSLDGFVAGPHDEVYRVFSWMSAGEVTVESQSPRLVFRVTRRARRSSRARRAGPRDRTADVRPRSRPGRIASGWRLGWIPTHHPPAGWHDAPFTFVTERVEAAVKQGSEHAGDGTVGVAGGSVVRECLNGGILDAVRISLVRT